MTAGIIGVEQGLAYHLVASDGSRAVLNDSADPDFVGYLDQPPTGLERAGVRVNADTLPEADGQTFGAFRREGLSFTLQGIVPPDVGTLTWLARQDRLLRVTDALEADTELRWWPSENLIAGNPDPVRVRFRAGQATRISGRRPKAFIVAGICEDPVVESLQERVHQVTPILGGQDGMESPLVSPLSSVPTAPAGTLVENRGSGLAWPTLTVYGPCSGITLRNATTGQDLVLNYTLAGGERLVIDTNPRRRTIRLNGTANRYSALVWALSSWWGIRPGVNDLRLGLASFSGGALLEIVYRDTWG